VESHLSESASEVVIFIVFYGAAEDSCSSDYGAEDTGCGVIVACDTVSRIAG